MPLFLMFFMGCISGPCHHAPILRPAGISLLTFVSGLSVTSGTVSIDASTPDTSPFTSVASVKWNVLAAILGDSWSLKVQANAASFTSCPLVPLSAVHVSCNQITDTALIGGSTKACNSNITLSTTSQTVATGTDPVVGLGFQRQVDLNFTFTDSWTYPATSSACTVSLTYSLGAA